MELHSDIFWDVPLVPLLIRYIYFQIGEVLNRSKIQLRKWDQFQELSYNILKEEIEHE